MILFAVLILPTLYPFGFFPKQPQWFTALVSEQCSQVRIDAFFEVVE